MRGAVEDRFQNYHLQGCVHVHAGLRMHASRACVCPCACWLSMCDCAWLPSELLPWLPGTPAGRVPGCHVCRGAGCAQGGLGGAAAAHAAAGHGGQAGAHTGQGHAAGSAGADTVQQDPGSVDEGEWGSGVKRVRRVWGQEGEWGSGGRRSKGYKVCGLGSRVLGVTV